MLEQGNGMLNAKVAVELAKELDLNKGEVKKKVSPVWLLGGQDNANLDRGKKCKQNCEEVWAGGAFAFADRIYYGDLIDPNGSNTWGDGVNWANSILWSDSIFGVDSIMWADPGPAASSHLGQQHYGADSILWSDSIMWSNSIMWADNTTVNHSSAYAGD